METENDGEPANTGLPDTTTQQHPFNGPLSRTTRVSRYRKGKTNLDFTEARDSEWQWHQLGHMQVCTSLQTDNHASTPPLSFLQAGCPSCHPTSSVKALKAMVYPKMDVKTVVDLFHGDLAGKCREWHSRLAQPLVAAGMPELRVEECEYAWVGRVLQPLWICMSRWSRWVAWPRQWLQECRSWGLKNVRHEDRRELTAATVGFTSYHNRSIKPGKPGILRDFSESGNLREFSGCSVEPQGKIVTIKVVLVCHSNVCVKQLLTGQTGTWTKSREFLTWSERSDDLLYCWSWCGMTLDEGHYYIYFLSR